MRKIIGYTGVVIGTATLLAAFVAYFIVSIDAITHVHYDGFGRPLSKAPELLAMILPVEDEWAGLGWWVADIIIFWSSLGVALGLVQFGFHEKAPSSDLQSLTDLRKRTH